jgi:hypothetical protein
MLGDFLLAPPGGCGSTVDCGWVALRVMDESGLMKVLETQSAQSPIRVDLPKDRRNRTVVFHAELRDADSLAVLKPNGKALSAEFTVTLDGLNADWNGQGAAKKFCE